MARFINYKNAVRFINDFTPKMDAGKAKAFVRGQTEPAPWRSVSKADVDGMWTRFAIEEQPDGEYEVVLCTWPEGSITDSKLACRIQIVTRIEE